MSSHSSLICQLCYQLMPTSSSTPTSSVACRSPCTVPLPPSPPPLIAQARPPYRRSQSRSPSQSRRGTSPASTCNQARPSTPRPAAASYRNRRRRLPTASTTTTSAVELAGASPPAAGIRKTSDCPAGYTYFAVAVWGIPHVSQGQCFPHKLSCRYWRCHQSYPVQFFFIADRSCNSKC